MARAQLFCEIFEEMSSDLGGLHQDTFGQATVVFAHLLRALRKLAGQFIVTSILFAVSFGLTGNPLLALGTAGVYSQAARLGLAAANRAGNALLLLLLPLSLMTNLHTVAVFAVLILIILLNRWRQSPNSPKCAPRRRGIGHELLVIAVWAPQVAIGVVTYGLQRHHTSSDFLWSLAREGYRTEPWLLGLICLVFCIVGALKSADRGFQK